MTYLIVGAGFSGATIAERLATQLGKKVLVVDKRDHIGGNAYDYYDNDGILIQKYGPHIFHTSNKAVWDYLSQFTRWNKYVHRVLAHVNGLEVHLPINLETMEKICKRSFTPEELRSYFERTRTKIDKIANSRDVIVSQVGEELYELFFKNYTKKQWGLYPEELAPSVTARLPLRFNRDTRYFSDKYQGIPEYGYTQLFGNLLHHTNIQVILGMDYRYVGTSLSFDKLIFTGPIDDYFDCIHGKLPYRSLDFEFKTLGVTRYQDAAVVNYPNDYDYTRVTEFKHFYFQNHPKTTICFEYPKTKGDPFYPIPKKEYLEIYKKYEKEAKKLKSVYFIGRLGRYSYLNMDQAVWQSLNLFEKLKS